MRALYFPSLEAPSSEWFNRTLLYWDSVGLIIPEDYIDYGDRTRQLMDAGLVKAVNPVPITLARGFTEAFMGLLETDPPLAPDGTEWAREHVYHHAKFEGVFGLLPELMERGLARQLNDGWVALPPEVGTRYMAYLAGFLCCEVDDMVPVTDSLTSARLGVGTLWNDPALLVEDGYVKSALLSELLPAPVGAVSAEQIISFKDENEEALQRFRDHVDQHLHELMSINEPARRLRAAREVGQIMSRQVREIEEAMRRTGWARLKYWTIAAFSAGPGAAEAVMGADPVKMGLATPPLLLAAATAAGSLKRNRRDLATHPLAYAALAAGQLSERSA